MLGDKTKFSLDRFQLDRHCPEAIGIVFINVNEIKEFYSYLNNIKFNMEFLPPQEEVITRLENAINNVTIWKNIDIYKEKYLLGLDLFPAKSDYYYSDIIFDTYADVDISYSDLMNFLGGN